MTYKFLVNEYNMRGGSVISLGKKAATLKGHAGGPKELRSHDHAEGGQRLLSRQLLLPLYS